MPRESVPCSPRACASATVANNRNRKNPASRNGFLATIAGAPVFRDTRDKALHSLARRREYRLPDRRADSSAHASLVARFKQFVRQGSFPSKVTASYESDPSEWPALRPEDADAVFKAVLP
jgi:hypothetical protein